MKVWILALALTFALAGCIHETPEPVTLDDPPVGPPDDQKFQEDDARPNDGDSDGDPDQGRWQIETYNLTHAGQVWQGICVNPSHDPCIVTGDPFLLLGVHAHPINVRGTLRWQPDTFLTEQLFVYLVEKEDDKWKFRWGEAPSTYGSSPIYLDWDLDHLADKELAIWVTNSWGACASGSCYVAQPGQDFLLDVTLTVATLQ